MAIENDRTVSAGSAATPGGSSGEGDEDVAPGTQVGEYVVEHKLGEGGFGAVYRATHPVIGKVAAVKVLHRAYSTNHDMVSRFIAEARAVNQIRHRNIIDIFAFGQLPDRRQYYLMELLEGAPFDKHLERVGRMEVAEALPVLRAVGRALDAAHAAGIVHRDLKPENVFLVQGDDGQVFPKLLDFGIAKLLPASKDAKEGKTPGSSHKTATGVQIGTPYYMSPEQCRGIGVDHRTDLYAFGIMTHRVLTGQLPFEGESMMDVMMKHMATPPPPMSSVLSSLPVALDAPVLQLLAKDPEQRPRSHIEAIDALEQAARSAGLEVPSTAHVSMRGGASPEARALPTPPLAAPATTDVAMESMTSKPRARPMVWVLGALLLGALAAGAFFAVRSPHVDDAHRDDPGPRSTASTTSPPSTSSTPAATTPSTSPPPTPSAAASAQPVAVRIEVVPKGAVVYQGDVALGPAPGPFQLTPGGDPVSLRIVAPGYVPKTIDVAPKEGLITKVTLLPEAKTKTPKPISSDLESPF